jgi:lipopolysaccharide transport system permease protein
VASASRRRRGARARVIDAADPRLWPDPRELWRHRELLWFLAWRDVQLRYRQTALGVLWAILQPLLTTIVLTILFSRIPGFSPPGVPYPVYCYSGFLFWNFFASGIGRSTTSLSSQSNLLGKVYFPRILVPVASILGALPDLGVAFLGLVALMAVYRVVPGLPLLLFPAYLLLVLAITLAVGIWLAALGTRYRDVRYTIPFLVQFWMLASPVFYATRLVEERFNGLLYFNPMTAVLLGVRWTLGIGPLPAAPFLAVCLGVTLVLLVLCVLYFDRSSPLIGRLAASSARSRCYARRAACSARTASWC